MLQHADAQRHTLPTPAKRLPTKLWHFRADIQGVVYGVTAGTTIRAGANGIGGDARPMETMAS